MSFDIKLFANKLKRYREQFQVTIEELSKATGISIENLKAYENAEKTPSGDDILILADYYKCDYKFFISNERTAPFDQTEGLFRLHGNEISKIDRWAIQEFLFLSDCESFLQETLGISSSIKFNFEKKGKIFKKHGEEAAKSLRNQLGYSKNQIPFNIFQDIRKMGIHVFRRKLENSNISGLYVKHPSAGKCILINYVEDIYRQRFTAAHELAHALLDDDQDFVISYTKWDKNDLKEIRANAFASCFLLPQSLLQSIADVHDWNTEKAKFWANKLKVSTTALAIALKNYKLIDYKNFQIIQSAKVPQKSKKDPELPDSLSSKFKAKKKTLLEQGLSSYYVKLCVSAYQQNIITAARMAEMLLIGENELSSIFDLFGERVDYAS